jgi:hypothetical protein
MASNPRHKNTFSDDFVHISQLAVRFAATASIHTSRTWSNGRCHIEKHWRIAGKLSAIRQAVMAGM